MYENIGSRIPGDIARDIEYLAREEKSDKSKILRDLIAAAVKEKILEIAIRKYASKKISLGRAAELARIPIAEFMMALYERKITVNYSLCSLQEDLEAATKNRRR